MSKGFFNWVKADGSTDFKPEKDRYHLYVSMVCPFAARPLAVRKLKGLEDVVSLSVLDSVKPKAGAPWTFNPQKPGCDEDTVNGCKDIKELYLMTDPNFAGALSVPLLWDKKKKMAVNNESIDIMRMFNKEFNEFCPTEEQKKLDLLPDDLKDCIEEINSWVAPNINLGVYKAGRAPNQEAYDKNVRALFEHLDKAELLLSQHRYLAGDKLSEADVRLFTTLVRFDAVYHGSFKCNVRRIQDYTNLFGWLCDMYQTGGLKETVSIEDIKAGYYMGEIVPKGPHIDLDVPHNRNKKGFFNWIKADGSTDFLPEKDRYHLYVAMVCPFAGRALTALKLKGLDDVISVCVCDSVSVKGEGWRFNPQKPGCDEDNVNGCKFLKEVYLKADPNYKGSISVPLLWDKKKQTAVNNESSDIMRMFYKEFNAFCPTEEQRNLDLLPDDLKDQIEAINGWVGPALNIATFQAGRAPNQESYDQYIKMVFDGLDKAEAILSQQRFIAGKNITEADIRLFVTVIRFDVAYYGAFKCNVKRIQDYPNLFRWTCDIYQTGNVKDTINFDEIKAGVYGGGIIPIGPHVNLNVPHNRDIMF